MANLYLTEQHSVLRKRGNRLVVEKKSQQLLEVRCHEIEAVLLFGNIQFTTQAIHKLFEHNIELALLSQNGRLKGQLTSPTTANITLRLAQFKKYEDKAFKLALSRIIIAAKINNSLVRLRRYGYNHPEVDLSIATTGLTRAITAANNATDTQALLGIEGSAARNYFAALATLLPSNFNFSGRRKRPPPDPINGLLSLGYTMLFNEISSLLDGIGFDPYLGYLHKVDYGRASLAADLMEEFRAPVVDRLTFYLVNNRIMTPGNFYTHASGGVYLRQPALKRYFVEYEKLLTEPFTHPRTGEQTTLRRAFRIQAGELAATLRDGHDYRPFLDHL